MPFIITTAGRLADGRLHQWSDPIAVATLAEAADVVEATILKHDPDVMPAIHAPDLKHGRTIGPLPDGTVIEVRPVTWNGLEHEAGLPYPNTCGPLEIVAAFNAS